MIEIPKKALPGQPLCPLSETVNTKTVKTFIPGPGTSQSTINTESGDVTGIVATILGKVKLFQVECKEKGPEKYIIAVAPKASSYSIFEVEEKLQDIPKINEKQSQELLNASKLPQEGDIVLARVTKTTLKQASVEILVVEGRGSILPDSGVGSTGLGTDQVASGVASAASHMSIVNATSASINSMQADLGETFKGLIRSQDIQSTDRDKVKIADCFKPGDTVRAVIISLGDGSNYYLSTARNDLGVVLANSEDGEVMYALDWQTMISPQSGKVELRKCAKPF